MLQALDFVHWNYSFASANNNKKFKFIFPDHKIAERYTQGQTKTKYVIEYGIAPYIGKAYWMILSITHLQIWWKHHKPD